MRFLLACALVLGLFSSSVLAQSTATPVLPGLLTTSGCPPATTVCYVPYSSSNPLAVTVISGGGGGNVNLTGINGTAPGPSNPLSVLLQPGTTGYNVAQNPADASTTVTTGGTFQTVFPSNTSRVNCFIQNPTSATEVLYVHWNTASASTSNSASLGPGSSFTCAGNGSVVTGTISVTATSTGHPFVAGGS